mgnify:CR=1 FL=1
MPLNNNFYGVYKFATIRTDHSGTIGKNPYIIKSLTSKNDMPTSAKFFMQGTPQTKILDIGNTSEKISISAPILVPTQGNTLQDGLSLLNDLVALQYTGSIPNNFLPILQSVRIDISASEAKIDLGLESDGDPNNTTNIFEINYGTTAQNYIAETGLDNAARVAKNYDFCVDFGGFTYYVESCNLSVDVKTENKNFLGVYGHPQDEVPIDGLNDGTWVEGSTSYSGWQFPFIAIGGIEITATGKAAISIDNLTGATTNWSYNDSVTSDVNTLIARGNVTLQPTGVFRYETNNFNIIYNTTGQNVLPGSFAINKAVITTRNASFSEGVMYADFTVKAFVGV